MHDQAMQSWNQELENVQSLEHAHRVKGLGTCCSHLVPVDSYTVRFQRVWAKLIPFRTLVYQRSDAELRCSSILEMVSCRRSRRCR